MFCRPCVQSADRELEHGQVIDICAMFRLRLAFNQPIGNWNTGKVTIMSKDVCGAGAFNQPIGNWNTSQVTR